MLEARRSGPSLASFQGSGQDDDEAWDAPYVECRVLTAQGRLVASDGGSGDHRKGWAKGYMVTCIMVNCWVRRECEAS